jgi:hypothetical protein
VRNLCIVGLQWGDEGKGKIVDYYADRFHAVVRFNGGSNAGHTIVHNGRTFVFHLLPSGLLKKKRLLIGPGVALDPLTLNEELGMLAKEGGEADLMVDERCTLVTPLEKELDSFIEGLRGAKPIGTTKRGIGPSYAMRALRLTPRAGDLAKGDFDLSSAIAFYRTFLKEIPDLSGWTENSKKILAGRTGDVGGEIMALNDAGHSVMFEGAQGTLLDLIFGTYPFVTGAHTIASYVPAGLGIPNGALGDVMGVAKAYTTRVGGGPFPTEIPGETGEQIRKEVCREAERGLRARPHKGRHTHEDQGDEGLRRLLDRRRRDRGLLQGAAQARRGEAGLPYDAVLLRPRAEGEPPTAGRGATRRVPRGGAEGEGDPRLDGGGEVGHHAEARLAVLLCRSAEPLILYRCWMGTLLFALCGALWLSRSRGPTC